MAGFSPGVSHAACKMRDFQANMTIFNTLNKHMISFTYNILLAEAANFLVNSSIGSLMAKR